MWDDLVRGAIGAVVLVDTQRLEDCFPAVDYFEGTGLPFVVAVNCFDGVIAHALDDVREALAVPATSDDLCDARSRGRPRTPCSSSSSTPLDAGDCVERPSSALTPRVAGHGATDSTEPIDRAEGGPGHRCGRWHGSGDGAPARRRRCQRGRRRSRRSRGRAGRRRDRRWRRAAPGLRRRRRRPDPIEATVVPKLRWARADRHRRQQRRMVRPTRSTSPTWEDSWALTFEVNLTAQARIGRASHGDLVRTRRRSDGEHRRPTEDLGATRGVTPYTASKQG